MSCIIWSGSGKEFKCGLPVVGYYPNDVDVPGHAVSESLHAPENGSLNKGLILMDYSRSVNRLRTSVCFLGRTWEKAFFL